MSSIKYHNTNDAITQMIQLRTYRIQGIYLAQEDTAERDSMDRTKEHCVARHSMSCARGSWNSRAS